MTVTYKIKKKSLYEGSPYRTTKTKDDTIGDVNNLNLLVVAIQAMISEKNSRVKETKQ